MNVHISISKVEIFQSSPQHGFKHNIVMLPESWGLVETVSISQTRSQLYNWVGWWKSCGVAGRHTDLLCPSRVFTHRCAKVRLKQEQENPNLHPATSSLPPATQEHCALCAAVQPNIKPLAEIQCI